MAVGLLSAGVLLVAIALVVVRRRSVEPPSTSPGQPPSFVLRIEIPPGHPGCDAARALRDHRFVKEEAPALPLAECTNREVCACRYRHLPERRLVVRRGPADRRTRLRFEPDNPPRRSGPGRRRQDLVSWLWRG